VNPADPDSKCGSPSPTRKINVTDTDSRVIKDGRRRIQGYDASSQNLAEAGGGPVKVFVADTGYWSVDNATLDVDADILIAPMPMSPSRGRLTEPARRGRRWPPRQTS
jgi:hypothetical protein